MRELMLYLNNHFVLFSLCISLMLVLITTSSVNGKNRRLLILIVAATILLATAEYTETLFNKEHTNVPNFGRYFFSVLAYILRPIIIVLFYHIRLNFKTKKYIFLWTGVFINTIVYLIALLSYKIPELRFVIWYNDTNSFVRGTLGYTVYVVCALYLLFFIIISIIETAKYKTRKQIDYIIILAASLAIFDQVLVTVLELSYSNTSEIFIIGACLYYVFLNYEKAADEFVTHERQMQEKTTALMLSQIQPHFIYNTLTTIQVLCEIDPEKAASTIETFSKYLRMNTDALSKTVPVPVMEEVQHAMAYSEIEKIRFDNIDVIFEINDKDFKLPVLTIEPILENAIKYGIRAREKGIVTIKTYKENNVHYLIIEDNGVGFDVNNVKLDGKNHVGVENVKTRIINMSKGTFKIESTVDVGTTVTITIPGEE